MAKNRIANACDHLAAAIGAQRDARERMRQCRQVLGFGRQAVLDAALLDADDVVALQSVLRLARRASNGFCDTSTLMTKLAAIRMTQLGFVQLPVVCETKPKRIRTEAACLAVADNELPAGWWDTQTSLEAANAGRYLVAGIGADGACTVMLRHIDADEPFLNPREYKSVVESLPLFRLSVSTGRVFFGAAESLRGGVGLSLENGSYCCELTTLRSGRAVKVVATLVRGDKAVDPIVQAPAFRDLY